MYEDTITAIITTSPLSIHPGNPFLDMVYCSIRFHLADVPVVILADGVHPSHAHLNPNYQGYLRRLRAFPKHNTTLLEFPEYTHQLEMTRRAFELGLVKNPVVLWCEHDWAILPRPIPWGGFVQTILEDQELDSIRLAECDEGADPWFISPTFDRGRLDSKSGLPFLKTTEYFSCPNLTRKTFYERVLAKGVGSTFMDSVARAVAEHEDFRLAYYNPLPFRQRSIHLDGRDKENPNAVPKPPEDFRFK